MNVIRLKEFYKEHYNTYSGSWSKLITRLKPGSVCSYYNHLSSRPVGRSMQRSLKLKLQNAINQAFVDTGSPAIFVGGRRRNRKKRKTKNGQIKKKTKKGGVTDPPSPSLQTRQSSYYYQDVVAKYDEPKVSCLDIEEPVFAKHPIKSRLKDADRDSMYDSSDSLSSFASDRNSLIEKESVQTTERHGTNDKFGPPKIGLPRLHSEDSGVFDDDNDEDIGFCDEVTTEYEEQNIQDELLEACVDDNELEDGETFSLVIVNEHEFPDFEEQADGIEEQITETCMLTEVLDKFEEVKVDVVESESAQEVEDDNLHGADVAVLQLDVQGDTESFEVKELHGLEEADPFLKFVHNQDDEEEIVFDLSQLEVNNLDEVSKTKDANTQQLKEDQKFPTVLEDEIPLTVPLDLLIDDDDNDEVLFEAGNRKKELSITCNPLYEYTVKDEEDRLSIKSYQSGFKTNFDNINLIQIPVPASDKAAHKSLKESTPLMKRQPIWGDRDDELACCVIL